MNSLATVAPFDGSALAIDYIDEGLVRVSKVFKDQMAPIDANSIVLNANTID